MRQPAIILILYFLTTTFSTFGQKTKDIFREDVYNGRKFILDSSGYHGQTTADTIFDLNKKVKENGQVALEADLKKSNLRVGMWTAYYPNGKTRCQGSYQIDSYINCCFASPCRQFINYKMGRWIYYYDNGQIKAQGVYKLKKEKIKTSCKRGDYILIASQDDSWTYFNENGGKINPTDNFKKELENVGH